MLGIAIAIAAKGFKDKTDKGGEPYILHCLRVMNSMSTPEEKILGVLHDVVEDGVISIEELRALGFSEDILDDLKLLTHLKEDDYLDVYIKKISTSKRATKVKLADLKDNSDITRLKGLRKKDFDRMEKYHKAFIYLSN
jgi:(p)ppGpp synthase/HD superfamily hydrolase